jgi:hypothetical protein
MKAFLVAVNGKRVTLAGIGNTGVLGVTLDWVGGKSLEGGDLEERLKLSIGGLDTRTSKHVYWDSPGIAVGDEISIKIVEAETADAESYRFCPKERND